jgi:hypothetical protein
MFAASSRTPLFVVVSPQQEEGRGWADMKPTTADNTYTGKDGTKRD